MILYWRSASLTCGLRAYLRAGGLCQVWTFMNRITWPMGLELDVYSMCFWFEKMWHTWPLNCEEAYLKRPIDLLSECCFHWSTWIRGSHLVDSVVSISLWHFRWGQRAGLSLFWIWKHPSSTCGLELRCWLEAFKRYTHLSEAWLTEFTEL